MTQVGSRGTSMKGMLKMGLVDSVVRIAIQVRPSPSK